MSPAKTTYTKTRTKRTAAGSKTASQKNMARRSTKGRSGPRRSGAQSEQRPPRQSVWSRISPERRLDIIGILLALPGLLTLLSMLSQNQSALTYKWVSLLRQTAGWGAFLLPVFLMSFGAWLLFRHIERFPQISVERVFGFMLLVVTILGWISFFSPGYFEPALKGQGGGYVGGSVEWLLVKLVDRPGAVIILLTMTLLGLIFALDISVTDLLRGNLQPAGRESFVQNGRQPKQEEADFITEKPVSEGSDLLPALQPLPPVSQPAKESGVFRSKRPETDMKPEREKKSSEKRPASGLAVDQDYALPASTVWKLPELKEILAPAAPQNQTANVDSDRGRLIEETLRSFGAPGRIVEIHRGPAITQFGVEPEFIENRAGKTRVRVARIAALADDLALALAAPSIRIQAPVPGCNYVGIEVPNVEPARVSVRDIIESDSFNRLHSPMRFALGKDVAGRAVASDLASLPHLLIAGTTGSGKSVCVNAILTSLLLFNTPETLRMILVDPKRVELAGYNGLPHLLMPVVVDSKNVLGALQWVLREMESRLHRFAEDGARHIQDYNARHPEAILPFLLVVIDELSDLMMLAPADTERSITRLAQVARASGIHLIIATQRPDVNVVTGLIKANLPSRIAFSVASNTDSRVILDQPGAEKLLGRGDMLYQASGSPAPVRLQGAYVSDGEIQNLVDYWVAETERVRLIQPGQLAIKTSHLAEELPSQELLAQKPLFDEAEPEKGSDPLLGDAIDLVRREGRVSISMLQRRMKVGYLRAAKLIDAMEERKIISSSQSTRQEREVLDYGPTAPPQEDGM